MGAGEELTLNYPQMLEKGLVQSHIRNEDILAVHFQNTQLTWRLE